jgi:hypothetical protein
MSSLVEATCPLCAGRGCDHCNRDRAVRYGARLRKNEARQFLAELQVPNPTGELLELVALAIDRGREIEQNHLLKASLLVDPKPPPGEDRFAYIELREKANG